ncbi:MAG: hypothetical protein NTX75_02930 [Proteobacteria bacterium]|nr:hypothetical protein [Pseudomonadota bacterium]
MLNSRLFKYSILIPAVVFLLLTTFEMRPAFALTATMDCDGTTQLYRQQGIPCYCKGGRIICNGPSSKTSYGKSSKKGGYSKNTMGMQILQGAMNNFASAFMNSVNAPAQQEQTGPTPQQIAAQQAEWERVKVEWQVKVQKQIGEMEAQYLEMEKKKVSESKARLLAGMKGVDTAATGRQSTAMQQLSCNAYWGMKAAKASLEGDENNARNYSRFAEKPDAVSMAECAKALPQPSEPSPADNFRSELYESIIEEVSLRIPMIEQAKEKQRGAVDKVAEKQQKVEELKNSQAPDDLVAAAMKELEEATNLKNEADAGVNRLQLELNALNEVGKMANAAKQ